MNFFKTTFRYLTKDGTFSFINIFGLASGLTAVLCISLYIVRESNYDSFHNHADRIFRIGITTTSKDVELKSSDFTPPIGAVMKEEVPEVEEYARMSTERPFVVACEDKVFKLTGVRFADTSFFDMFSFKMLTGDARTALAAPFSIVLTEESAHKLFGDGDAVGQVLRMDTCNYTVTGTVKSPPANSQIKFNALTSFSTLYKIPYTAMHWNGGNQFITYLRLNAKAGLDAVETKMQAVIWENLGKYYAQSGWQISGSLQALSDVHLHHDESSQYLRLGILVLSILTFIILAIACINFVNLTTARSMKRTKEAGLRKILGARRANLVKQFLGESLLISTAAFALSLLIFKTLEPFYVQLAGDLPETRLTIMVIVGVFALAMLTGLIGGSYPAIRLSSLDMSDTAKGAVRKGRRRMQSALIVAQFAGSTLLLVCTIAASQQLAYMRDKDVGIDREGILVVPFNGNKAAERVDLLKTRLQNLAGISAVSLASDEPYDGLTSNGYLPEGMENPIMIHVLDADENYLDVYGIALKEGRFFSEGVQDKTYYVVNESLVKTLGWQDEAIGKTIERNGRHQIIGVVGDFNYAPLYSQVEPLIITNMPVNGRFASTSIKYRVADVPALVSKVEKIWNEVNPDTPFEYNFFDELYDSQYKIEMRFRALFAVFAVIAIILAALGVLSLMAYTTEQRRKEIGIRKTLGASTGQIIAMLLQQTGVQVLVANLLALPAAWWIVQKGLGYFAYRISLSPMIFVEAFAVSAIAALLAVGWQALKAASANPVKAIQSN